MEKLNNYRVLIVEDEMIIAMALAKTLESMGLAVLEIVTSGESALEFLKKNSVDLVIMDIILGEKMNGIETAQIIDGSIPIVFHSGFCDIDHYQKALSLKPAAILKKPVSDNIFREAIRKIFSDNPNCS